VDIYHGSTAIRKNVWVENKTDTFFFTSFNKPELVNFDGDKILLCTKTENKTLDEYIHQYKYAAKYLDRREAIDFASKKQDDPKAVEFLKMAAKDKFDGLRAFTISKLDMKKENIKKEFELIFLDLAKNDPKRLIKALAITKLGQYKNPQYESLFKAAVNDSSYTVSGNALEALYMVDSAAALMEAKRLSSQPTKGNLSSAITSVIIKSGDESSSEAILSSFEKMPLSQAKFNLLQSLSQFLGSAKTTSTVKRGIDDIVSFRDAIPESFKSQTDPFINGVILKGLATKKKEAGLQDQADYIISKLPDADKKGF
jgi:aminopeptidase N